MKYIMIIAILSSVNAFAAPHKKSKAHAVDFAAESREQLQKLCPMGVVGACKELEKRGPETAASAEKNPNEKSS
jgi:hypothetical protein